MAKKESKSFILRVDAETMNNGQLQWIITEALRKAKRLPKKKKDNGTGEI